MVFPHKVRNCCPHKKDSVLLPALDFEARKMAKRSFLVLFARSPEGVLEEREKRLSGVCAEEKEKLMNKFNVNF